MADFPSLTPSSRQYDPGDWANTKYLAQSGAEFRILYANKRTGMKLQLVYNNITDVEAKSFLDHYEEMNGTFKRFPTTDKITGAKDGMSSDLAGVIGEEGSNWRYAEAPQLASVYPGVSTVTVNLICATTN